MVSFISFLAAIWQHLTPTQSDEFGFLIVFWGGTLGIQLALILWTFLVCEQYKIVFYIEKKLWPHIRTLVRTSDFWLYEQQLRERKQLKKWLELQTELWVFIIILAVVLFRLWTSHRFVLWDWIGLTANAVLFGVLVFWAITAAKIRQKWED